MAFYKEVHSAGKGHAFGFLNPAIHTINDAVHKLQLHPPTGVTHAVAGFVTHAQPRSQGESTQLPDLIVARGTLLQIFTVR